MQETLTYVIIFGFGIVLISLYFYRTDKKRLLPLSEQWFSNLSLIVSVEKEKGKLTHVIISLNSGDKNNLCTSIGIELIDSHREIKYLKLDPLIQTQTDHHYIQSNRQAMVIKFTALQKFITDTGFPLQSIRFVAETKTGKKYKSHELAFNDRWHLFKIDSGKYN